MTKPLKIFLLLFSLLISFNSYGLFHKTVCVETDAQDRDGVIYLPNKTKPFTGKNLCEYENGQNKSKGKVEDGKKDDIWTEWEENGQVKFEITYNLGQILREKNYQNGVEKNETSFSFNENGLLETKGNYKEGNLVGETKYSYNENGQIEKESNFTFGNLISHTEFSYFNNGLKSTETNYKMGKKHGKIIKWFADGQKSSEIHYKDDKLDGRWTWWYKNGQIYLVKNYKDGKGEGSSTEWDQNGQIKFRENYKNGKKINYIQYSYYPSGEKKAEVNYKGDMNTLDGTFTVWYKNGQKRMEDNYRDNKADGKWTSWNENGQIMLERNFKDGECISGDC